MKVYKNKGIIYAEAIVNLLANRDLEGTLHIDLFYNSREQGYKVIFYTEDYKAKNTIWIYAQRNSDKPTITWKEGYGLDEIFDEESWAKRTISFDTIEEAVNKIGELLNQ
jgi:transposase